MIIEARQFVPDKIRTLCINNEWFTRGNNEEYAHLFELAERHIASAEAVFWIAEYIADHSELSRDYSREENIDNIAFQIINYATLTTFSREA